MCACARVDRHRRFTRVILVCHPPDTAVLGEDVGMATLYEIVVKGELGPTTACAFEGMRLEARDGETAIVGEIADQAQLSGLLNRVSELGLELVSVGRLHEDTAEPTAARGG